MHAGIVIGLIIAVVIGAIIVKAYGNQLASFLPKIRTEETRTVIDSEIPKLPQV